MQTMDTKVDGGTFTCLYDFFFNLLFNLGNNLLNACWVYTSVCHQLMERQTADFTANRIEGADNNCLGRVINHDFCASRCLQCTDIASFTSNDTAFHFVRVNVENGYAVLNGCFSSHTLDALDDNSLGFFGGRHLGIVDDFVDVLLSLCFSLVFHTFHQMLLGFFGRQSADGFEL